MTQGENRIHTRATDYCNKIRNNTATEETCNSKTL